MSAWFSFGTEINGVSGDGNQKGIDRQPWAAGRFYPKDSAELIQNMRSLFKDAVPKKIQNVFAIISPHAGYYYSGIVAASAFSQIDPERQYENIFVIASSHKAYFDGASIFNCGDYLTPLGRMQTNIDLANKITNGNSVFRFSPEYHDEEHSLEVQLPFLQYHLKTKYKIIPIIIGTDNPATCRKIALALKPYRNSQNLFIISTDFSHYPSAFDAVKVDRLTADAICSNKPDNLIKALKDNEEMKYDKLATSLCGFTSVLTLMYLTEDMDIHVSPVLYQNSGDAPDGDKSRVVGYQAIAFSNDVANPLSSTFTLSSKDKTDLLSIARRTLVHYLLDGEIIKIDSDLYSENLRAKLGAFVSLHKDGRLRGCIGQFTTDEPLCKLIQEMAISAATGDSRFSRVKKEELPLIDIEISVLTPLKKIKSIDEIELGKNGIYIRKGLKSGTFLPQVAKETGWTREEFLGHCAKDKAGLDSDGWKDAEIFTYEAIVFGEE